MISFRRPIMWNAWYSQMECKQGDYFASPGINSFVLIFEGLKIPITPCNPTLITILIKKARKAVSNNAPARPARII